MNILIHVDNFSFTKDSNDLFESDWVWYFGPSIYRGVSTHELLHSRT